MHTDQLYFKGVQKDGCNHCLTGRALNLFLAFLFQLYVVMVGNEEAKKLTICNRDRNNSQYGWMSVYFGAADPFVNQTLPSYRFKA